MSVHLLECECGKQVPVEPRQAGSQIPCPCGKQVTAPSMREIRALPTADIESSSEKYRETWSLKKGVLFVTGGLIIIAASLMLAFLVTILSGVDTSDPVIDEQKMQATEEFIEKAPPDALVDQFLVMEQQGLDVVPKHPYLAQRALARRLWIGIAVCGGFIALGLGVIGYAVVSK